MDKIRVGVIGAGWWATTNHIPQLKQRDDVELVAVCRLGQELLQQIKSDFGFQFATEDYLELLEQPLDAVIVSSPHFLHYQHAKAALEKGCHVMLEKPMTLNGDHAWELVKLAQEKGLHLLVPYGWHYKDFIQKAKQWMDEIGIGRIEYAMCHMASPTKNLFAGKDDTFSGMPEDWTPSFSAPEPSTWQVKQNGGGYAHGQITHSSALLFWLTGLRAAEVTARMTAPDSEVDLYDAATVAFDNGAIGVISGAGTVTGGEPYQIDIRLFGSDGMLLLDIESGRERVVLNRNDGTSYVHSVPAGEGEYDCFVPPNRFIDVIRGEGSNDSPGDVAASTVELITAMFRSAEQHSQPVEV